MTSPVETDLLERAREHRWWYSDTNMATLLMHEIERLREENEELKRPRCDADHATEIERLLDIIEDLDEHEGAEGWSEDLRVRVREVLETKT